MFLVNVGCDLKCVESAREAFLLASVRCRVYWKKNCAHKLRDNVDDSKVGKKLPIDDRSRRSSSINYERGRKKRNVLPSDRKNCEDHLKSFQTINRGFIERKTKNEWTNQRHVRIDPRRQIQYENCSMDSRENGHLAHVIQRDGALHSEIIIPPTRRLQKPYVTSRKSISTLKTRRVNGGLQHEISPGVTQYLISRINNLKKRSQNFGHTFVPVQQMFLIGYQMWPDEIWITR